MYITGTTQTNSQTNSQNKCITFTISSGTGCEWMCNYCAENLGTNNYFFTDNVCKYEPKTGYYGFYRSYEFDLEHQHLSNSNGCVGNPIAGNSYTCCTTTTTK
jgi:hypothetical protein